IYNVLVENGAFAKFRHWLVAQATADVRVQAILMAWALGALLEGLVGFGYPWAVIAPILVGLGVAGIDAIRVAAIGNDAPVSFGALLLLLRYWRPAETLGFGGVPVTAEPAAAPGPAGTPGTAPVDAGSPGTTARTATGVAPAEASPSGWREAVPGFTAFGVL